MIVLVFEDPGGHVGFTEALDSVQAAQMIECYKQHGYRLLEQFEEAAK